MSPSESIRKQLDERKIVWWTVESLDKVPLTVCVIDGVRYKFRPQGCGIIVSSCTEGTVTPEQAIAATVGIRTDLSKRLREVTGLRSFAELFGFDWHDGSDWDWHDLACAMADAIDTTVGNTMTLDEAIERIEQFMGDYAKLLLASTMYMERDEPTDQHAFDVAEQKEAQMARTLAEALATVTTEPDEPDTLKLHERMNSVLLDMNEVLVPEWHREDISTQKLIDCVIAAHQIIEDAAKVGVGTCHYYPDDAGFTWWDENDVEHYEEDSASYECDSASCGKCGFPMMVGEEGWFDGWEEITEWTEKDGSEHKGYILKPRFKYCPRCGRKVTE